MQQMTEATKVTTQQLQAEMQQKLDAIEKAFHQKYQSASAHQTDRPVPTGIATTCRGQVPTSHRTFKDDETLKGNINYREWSRMVITELQILGIVDIIFSELAHNAPWQPEIRLRADAMARSIILQSVDQIIKSQVTALPTAFHMWSLLQSRFHVVSMFEQPKLMAQLETLSFHSVGSAQELIRQGILIRDKYNAINPDLPEKFWTDAILRKLLPYYQFESQLLLQQQRYTLDLVYRYFVEFVFDSGDPGKTNLIYNVSASSDSIVNNVHKHPSIKGYSNVAPRFVNNKSLLTITYPGAASTSRAEKAETQQPTDQPGTSGVQKGYRNQQNRHVQNDIPIRAFNPAVPILQGPRNPPPRGSVYDGTGPRADGNRCIGCGMSGHNTYTCQYGNIPFCYCCKRFGHIRAQCRPEWVAELPRDRPMQVPPVIPEYALRPTQVPAIQQQPTAHQQQNGNLLRVSCMSNISSSSEHFILDTGASYHIVNNSSILSDFITSPHNRNFFTADGTSLISIQGTGTLTIKCSTRDTIAYLSLKNVLVAPKLPLNVISVAKLCADNLINISFSDTHASFFRCELVPSTQRDPSDHPSIPKSADDYHRENTTGDVSFFRTHLDNGETVRAVYYASPFFAVPKTADNLYSFTLVRQFSNYNSFQPQIVSYFNPEIPPNTCRPVLLILSQQVDQTGTPRIGNISQLSHQSEGDSTTPIHRPHYRTKSGKEKKKSFTTPIAPLSSSSVSQVATLWHRRFAHASVPVIRQALHISSSGYKIPSDFKIDFCEVCTKAKLTQKSYDKIRSLPTRLGEIISADIIGPITPVTYPHGYKYVLAVIDNFSKYARVFLLKTKSQTGEYLKVFF